MGLQARLMSKALRKLTGSISKSSTVMIFINQIREKIGGFSFVPGVQTTTSGGRALKFFSTVRMEVKRIGSIKQGDEVIGNETLVKVTKNKVSPPFKEARFNIMYGKGISKIGEILDIAIDNGIVAKSGAWFSYGDERLGQGRVNVENSLAENTELLGRIETDVMKIIKPAVEEEEEVTAKEEAKETKPAKETKAKKEKKDDENK